MPFKNPHPLYSVWQSMRGRCRNPKFKQWADYGGRGITICPEWDSFHQFVGDMGSRPDGYSLDRINNDLGYSPSNCRWSDKKTQQRNQRTTIHVIVEGKQYKLVELVDQLGITRDAILGRAAKGVAFADLCTPLPGGPARSTAPHCKRGHEYTEATSYFDKKGRRSCRVCHREKMQRYNAAKKSQP